MAEKATDHRGRCDAHTVALRGKVVCLAGKVGTCTHERPCGAPATHPVNAPLDPEPGITQRRHI